MALRLGCSRETVELARRQLLAYGLLHKRDLGQGYNAEWMPILPEDCQPPKKRVRLTDDETQALAERLAARIRAQRAQSGVKEYATSGLQ
jgi:hypothetical protein